MTGPDACRSTPTRDVRRSEPGELLVQRRERLLQHLAVRRHAGAFEVGLRAGARELDRPPLRPDLGGLLAGLVRSRPRLAGFLLL